VLDDQLVDFGRTLGDAANQISGVRLRLDL
jgi:hypothetical protein